jgi:hypothetical protein
MKLSCAISFVGLLSSTFQFIHKNLRFLLGVRELVTALFCEIYFAEILLWDGINSVIKGGNKLPHSTERLLRS